MKKNILSLLQEKLQFLGFRDSDEWNEKLEQIIQSRPIRFDLSTEVQFDKWTTMKAILCFKWSVALELYSLVTYEASLHYDHDPEKERTHSFSIVEGQGITIIEAFNLLEGRAVNKDFTDNDGEKYNAWIQLDFNERTPTGNYAERKYGIEHGYSLEKILETYPIRELQDEALKENLIQSLKKGNLHPITFVKANKIQKMYIDANPQYKTIDIITEAARVTCHLRSNGMKNDKDYDTESQ